MAGWIEQCKEAPINDVVLEVGLHQIGKGFAPCPECGAETRGSKDRRGTIYLGEKKQAWRCYTCGARGDALNLVSQVLYQMNLKDLGEEDQGKVREWFAVRRWCDPDSDQPGELPPPPKRQQHKPQPYPDAQELLRFWTTCVPVHQTGNHGGIDMDVAKFLKARKWSANAIDQAGFAKLTPHPDDPSAYWPEWWPKGRAGVWRLVVPAYSSSGVMKSLQGRAIVTKPDMPKVLWPKDRSASRLIMADRQGLKFLQRRDKPQIVIICEGMTDTIAVSIHKESIHGKVAVLGCASGGFKALRDVFIPRGVDVYAAPDEGDKDGKGDQYAIEIATSLSPTPVRRLPLSQLLK